MIIFINNHCYFYSVPRGNRTPNNPLGGDRYIRLTIGTGIVIMSHNNLNVNNNYVDVT